MGELFFNVWQNLFGFNVPCEEDAENYNVIDYALIRLKT